MALRAQSNGKGRVRDSVRGGLSGVLGSLVGQIFGGANLRAGLTNSLKGSVSAGAVLAGGLSLKRALAGNVAGGATILANLSGGAGTLRGAIPSNAVLLAKLTNSLKGAVGASPSIGGALTRKRALAGVVTGGATFTSALTGTASPAYVLYVAGQSNSSAEGVSTGNGSPPTPTGFVSDSGIKIWDGSTGAWATYAPGTNSMGQTSSTGQGGFQQWWGPECAFAMKWRSDNPTKTLYIVKHSYGGTGLSAASNAPLNWHPTTSSGLYSQLKTKSDAAKAALTGAGLTATSLGFIWVQGEVPDGNDGTNATNYNSNLTSFVSSVRTDMIGATTPFITARIKESNAHIPFGRRIATAEYAVATSDGHSVVFDTDSMQFGGGTFYTDQYHYLPAAILDMGGRAYAAAMGPTWFTDRWGSATSATNTSETFTVTGLLGSLAISVSGCQYSKNGGAYTSTAGTVTNGDTVTLQATASSSADTITSPTVTIGNAVRTWRIRTAPAVGSGLDGSESDGTNLFTHPTDKTFNLTESGGDWDYAPNVSGAGILPGRIIAPDGTLTGVEVREEDFGSGLNATMGVSASPLLFGVQLGTSGGTFSLYVRPANRRYMQIVNTDNSSFGKQAYVFVDLQTMSVSETGTITPGAGQSFGTVTFSAAKYGWTKITLPFVGYNDTGTYSANYFMVVGSDVATKAAAGSTSNGRVTYRGSPQSTAFHIWRPKLTVP